MRDKRGIIHRNIKESWRYIYESRRYIYFAALIFLLFALIGFIFPAPASIAEAIREFVNQLVNKTRDFNTLQLILYIFQNNLLASLFGLFLGGFLGLFPLFASIVNGYVVGFVAKKVSASEGLISLWKLIPHGIFELPAVLISFGIGIRLGMSLFSRKADGEFIRRLKLSSKVFIFVVIPLLIIAAIIEGFLISLIG